MYSQLIDKSNYFRGLLLLASRDNKISVREQGSIRKIARILNYEQEFVENALSGLLENQYISKEPPEFANKEFAKAFIKDGIKMVFVNWSAHFEEIKWLKQVSIKNGLPLDWFDEELENYYENFSAAADDFYEIQNIIKN